MTSRSGAALVIAIVVLAAMLMLGLPFLFTQSGSLSGIRSYNHGRLASIGQDSAQSMGVDAGARAVSYHLQRDGVTTPTGLVLDDWTDLFHDLNGSDPQSGLRRVGVNRIEFDTRNHAFALPGDRFLEGLPAAERDLLLQRYPTTVGLAIEDESGKLNPNHLNIRAWTRLLTAVGITDWTDGRAPQNDEGRKQLARALSVMRYQLPGGRITHLDQLLQAEPPATYGTANTPMPAPRRGLTRAELERLRPYLTVYVPAQARGGLIDLGTVLGVDGSLITLDHDEPQAVLAFPIVPLLIGVGTSLVVNDPPDPNVAAEQQGFVMPAIGETTRRPRVGAAVAIDAPPTINLHQAEEMVRRTFAPQPLPSATAPATPGQPPNPALLTALAGLGSLGNDALGRPRTPFDLLAPLSVVDERGTTHVLATRENDPGASVPFALINGFSIQVDPTSGIPVLDARASLIRVVTGSLDLFPARGFAAIFLNSDPNKPREIIEYRRSTPGLPLSNDEVSNLVEVQLRDVRRGLNGATGLSNNTAQTFPAGTDRNQYDRPADLHLTVLVPHEQHPVGIASQGVITISSTATVTDPAGNQTAQDQHRVIAQTLPQESALEARWDKQAAFHALLSQRHGSLLATFPRPNLRLTGVLPQDALNVDAMGTRYVPPFVPDDLDASLGVKPAVMRSLLTHPHLNRNWSVSFSGSGASALHRNGAGNPNESGPLGARYSTTDIQPEGLALDANRVLAYPNPSNGFLRDRYVMPDPMNANSGLLAPLEGRQFAVWVRPDANWNDQVALLDMRMPAANVSERLTGAVLPDQSQDVRSINPSDAAISNRFTLVYDPAVQQLVLVLNPGTIPHAADYGPAIPRQTYGRTTGIPIKDDVWPAVNPECLGNGGVHPMASTPPEVAIQYRYFVGDRFKRGEWHLVQVAFSSNQPGGMAIIVDGLVGRDVTRIPTDVTAMKVPGDHMTQPVLTLATDLPTTEQVRDIGTRALYVDRILLRALAFDGGNAPLRGAAAVRRLLPERGLVRIGREYISYQWIDDDGALRDCVRARRQRTHGGVDANGIPTWNESHVMEPHRLGDAVYPGGFAFSIQQNVPWYRGGCHLAQPMPDGDPAHKYQVWANVGIPLLEATSTAIPLVGGVIGQFPPRGYVLIGPHQVYYDNNNVLPSAVSPPGLLNVHYWGSITITNPDGSTTTRNDWISGLPTSFTATDEVVLISQEIAGADPTRSRAYAPSGFMQLYDARSATAGANAGRAEWISYSEIRSRTDYKTTQGARVSYLINLSEETTAIVPDPDPMQPPTYVKVLRGGFWFADGRSAPFIRFGTRARERTGFAAADFSDYNPTVHTFPALTTRVIPVQTDLEIAYLLEAGDVVTLAPQRMGNGQRALQMCVRYSADDSFPEDKGSASATAWNSMNRHFAFTEAIPDDWNPGNYGFHLLSWPCWTPEDDLSQLNTASAWSTNRLGWVLPWGNAFAPDFTPNNGSPANRSITFMTTGAAGTTGAVATIDAIHAGEQPGWQQGTQAQANIVPPDNNPWLDDQPLTARLTIRTDQTVFASSYGLIEIGGEVFAYKIDATQDRLDAERPMNPDPVRGNQAWLIARGLLGSSRRVHQGSELVLHLPIGPVAEIVEALPVDALGDVQVDGFFAAPAMLLTSRNGDRMELTTMPNNHTAPWLRGMYNTTPVAWTGRPDSNTFDNLAPLAIGWWPRYPSALPNHFVGESNVVADLIKKEQQGLPLSNEEQERIQNLSALLRSRSYAWAGFPLRFHDCLFKGTGLASVNVLSTGDGLFDLHALGLDGTFDWNQAGRATITTNGMLPTAPVDVSGAFVSDRFVALTDEIINGRLTTPANTRRPVDGAELRVVWSYTNPPLASSATPAQWLQQAATNGNRAPMIGPVYLRTRAPNKVLNVER